MEPLQPAAVARVRTNEIRSQKERIAARLADSDSPAALGQVGVFPFLPRWSPSVLAGLGGGAAVRTVEQLGRERAVAIRAEDTTRDAVRIDELHLRIELL